MKMLVPHKALLIALATAGCATATPAKRETAPQLKVAQKPQPPKTKVQQTFRGSPKEQALAKAKLNVAYGLLTGQIRITETGSLRHPFAQVNLEDPRFRKTLQFLIQETDEEQDGLDAREAGAAIKKAKEKLTETRANAETLAGELSSVDEAIPIFTVESGTRSNVNGLTVITAPEHQQTVQEALVNYFTREGLFTVDNPSSQYWLKTEDGALLRTRLKPFALRGEEQRAQKSLGLTPEQRKNLTEGKVGISVIFGKRVYSNENYHPIHLGLEHAREHSANINPRMLYGSARRR